MHQLGDLFAGIDYILHAGDITGTRVLEILETIAPVHAVRGNMDYDPALMHLPNRKIIDAEGTRIGLIHGWGAPAGLSVRVNESFRGSDVDVIIYGHSHHPDIQKIGSCLLINPGSPSDKRFAPRNTIAILTIKAGNPTAEVFNLE